MEYRYSVRRPVSGQDSLRRFGMVVSRHHDLEDALKALELQRKGAKEQGRYSQDYIWDERDDTTS